MRYFLHLTNSLLLFTCVLCAAAPEVFAQDIQSKLERANELRDVQLQKVEQLQPMKADDDLTSAGLKMAQALGFILGAFLIGAWAYKKYILKDIALPMSKIRILERVPVSTRGSVMLAEVDGKKILVGVTPQSIK